jgi:SRSO17 transposase
MVEHKVGCCPGGAVVARQRTNQPSKNDPASRLLALPRRLAAFCSRVKFLFRTQTDDGSGHARFYVHGLMQAKPRAKNMERMEEAVAGADYEGLQHFIADSPWAAGPVMDHVTQEVSQLLDGPLALCYIDETAFSKKGEKSVGVARQYNGRLGKVDNCQVAVFAALGRGDRAALVGARLYLPEEWCSDTARCKAAGIPEEDRAFKSKAALAFELILHLREIGARFEASVLDVGYGKDPALLRALDVEGEVFVVDVHRSQRMWLTDPWPVVPEPVPGRRGRAPQGANLSVADWAAGQPEEAWRTTVLRQGTKGEIRVQFIHQRVYFWDGVEECAKPWHLVARRTLDIDGQPDAVSFTISNAAAEVPAARVVAMACARYFIERGFQDAKSHLGLADYQIRGWRAWHHHMALVMLAMLFHLRERLVHAEDYPLLSCADLIELLCYFLPKAAVTAEDVLRQMDQRHRKRQASIDSAYTRQAPWEEPPEEIR